MLEVIDEENDRLNRFIEGLGNWRASRPEKCICSALGVGGEIITAALERAAPLTRDHKVHVRLDDGLPTVRVDDRSVCRVVYTLVDNAAKYHGRNEYQHGAQRQGNRRFS